MPRVSSLMNMGRRAMMNSKSALQTVSHNISNKDTEGYSRQRVELQTNEAVSRGPHRYGTGAKVSDVTRTVNPYLEKQIQSETNKMGMADGQAENLMRVEQIFNEQANEGLNRFISNFFNSFRELSNNPESLAIRTAVKESANHVGRDFKRVSHQLQDVQRDIDQQVKTTVEEANAYIEEIAKLNEKISMVELNDVSANDERDRRDLLIKKLSERMDIRWGEGDNGAISVTAGDNAILVSGFESAQLMVSATGEQGNKRNGNFSVLYRMDDNKEWYDITKQMRGGTLGGAIDIRDNVINKFRDDIDGLAYTLSKKVNDIHRIGYNRFDKQGVNFFEDIQNVRGASENIKLSEDIIRDVKNIASAGAPMSPADNRVSNAISALQQEKLMSDGNFTMDDFYNSVVGELGVITHKTNMTAEHQKNIVKQLNNVRESISGVSLDEETVKMIEYQKSFDASARLIRTADEMFDTVLSLKR